jgi:LacI family repressor for deo operon, udp, cdd, tsx, nupC, and nupG
VNQGDGIEINNKEKYFKLFSGINMKKYKVRDIAKLANVSPATVSRVFNGSAQVSEGLRERVLQVAAELGYTPPARAEGNNRLIGLLLPRLSNPFYTEIIQGVLDTAATAGYDMVIGSSNSISINDSMDAPSPFQKCNELAGLICLSRLQPNSWILRSFPKKMPIVQCSEYNENLPYPIISIDHYQAAFDATSYLINTGHKKLALYNSTHNAIYGKKREEGFRDALKEHGLPVREEWVLQLREIDFNLALAATQDLFSTGDYPDSVFCVSDIYAAGAIKGLAKLGIRVPEHVSVVGFDDTEIALINEPTLTTVRQPRYRLGTTAFNILLRYIYSRDIQPQFFWIESDLIIRGSTKSRLQGRIGL